MKFGIDFGNFLDVEKYFLWWGVLTVFYHYGAVRLASLCFFEHVVYQKIDFLKRIFSSTKNFDGHKGLQRICFFRMVSSRPLAGGCFCSGAFVLCTDFPGMHNSKGWWYGGVAIQGPAHIDLGCGGVSSCTGFCVFFHTFSCDFLVPFFEIFWCLFLRFFEPVFRCFFGTFF